MDPHYTEHLNRARNLLKEGKVDAAMLECHSILGSNPTHFDANMLLGQCLQQARRPGEAEQAFHQATQINPEHASPHQSLARLYHASGKIAAAVEHYEQALKIDPKWVNGWLDLGIAYQTRGQLQQAVRIYRHALSLAPDNAAAHNNLGSFLQQSGNLSGARDMYKKAIDLDPSFVDAIYNLGHLNTVNRNRDEAIRLFKRVLQLQPGREDATVGVAGMLERQGKIEQAYDYLRPLIQTTTGNSYTLINFAQVCASLGRADEAISPLESQLSRNNLYRREKIQMHFALGKLYDKQHDYDRAFLHYRQGNVLENATFEPADYQERVERTIQTYSPAFMKNAPRATNRSEMPVFIIAMPRSGTSLVEQILSAHPQVYGTGETGDIAAGSENLQALINNGTITTGHLDAFADKHLASLKSRSNGALRVTDKTVNSFMDVGLIHLLFPNARFIHCMRNPLDTCLSCYFSKLSDGHPYSYGLTNLAIFYRQYHRIMEHWKQIPGLQILEVRYEELVHDLEAGARSMVDFLNLDWDPACLDFHNTERQVTTISYDQVRRPVYTSSVNRWKNYEEQIGELKNALADLVYGS